jgi:uncharacterized membrane protein
MENPATNANIADYVSGSNYGASGQDRENTARLIIGGSLVLAGLLKGSPAGLLVAGIGGGFAALGCLTSERTEVRTATRPQSVKKTIVRRCITIGRSQAEVYEFWARPEKLRQIFPGIESIAALSGGRWLWRMQPVGSNQVSFETESIKNEPPTLMSWKSVVESPVEHAGSVTFREAPAGRGTEVLLTTSWIGKGSISQLGIPLLAKGTGWYSSEALRRSKQLIETGELSTAAF